MIKAWNRKNGRPFRSFYLELLVEKLLRNVRISDLSSACRFVFDKGRLGIKYTVPDPSGIAAEMVGGLNGGTVTEAAKRFDTAYARARRAESYVRIGRPAAAIAEWRKIFGDRFPAYG